MVKSGQQWSGLVVCKDATGALSTPTVGPVGVLYVNGTSNAASVTVSGSNPYKWTVTLPSLTAGDIVSMYITATVATIATASVVAEEVSDTERVSDLNDITTAQVNAEVVDALATDVIADSVATDGSRPTIAQALLMITRFLMERSVSSTTVTVKKENGTTSSMTFTLDDATAPTSITRAT